MAYAKGESKAIKVRAETRTRPVEVINDFFKVSIRLIFCMVGVVKVVVY